MGRSKAWVREIYPGWWEDDGWSCKVLLTIDLNWFFESKRSDQVNVSYDKASSTGTFSTNKSLENANFQRYISTLGARTSRTRKKEKRRGSKKIVSNSWENYSNDNKQQQHYADSDALFKSGIYRFTQSSFIRAIIQNTKLLCRPMRLRSQSDPHQKMKMTRWKEREG